MQTEAEGLARISRSEGGHTAEFLRDCDHSAESVWAALTDPALLPQWLAPGVIELREGGHARLDFIDSGIVIDSVVTLCEPLRLLEYSWSGPGEPLRPVTWSLGPQGGACRLGLTLGLPEGDDVARSCAGWEAHLDMLAALLEGVPIKFPFERFKAAREAYRGRVAA